MGGRVAILGATGCVGQTVLKLLEAQAGTEFILASRHVDAAQQAAKESRATCRAFAADASDADSMRRLCRERPDLLINVSGRFRWTGINVARAAVEHGVNLVDIGDEPLYVREVLTLHEEARARRCRLVIGSGTAPQTTGALLRLVLLRSGPGVDVCVGACFGINRVGPKAVRTALEAVSGLISLPEAPPVWQAKRTVNFGPPFHPLKLRTYPLPETVYVPAMPGVRSSSLGATLPEEWQNSTIGFLRRIGFARFSARTWLATPLTAFIAGVETRMARRGVAGSGIALYVEANRDGAPEVATLFHPDMTDLTAQALALTVGYLLGSTADPYFGVQLAHDVLEPQQFLDSLKPLGAQWELAGSAGERARVAHG